MQDECLICGAPLEYLLEDVEMKCAICGAVERSKTRCVAGCYVCDACHSSGVDAIFGVCLAEKSANPLAIFRRLTALPFCNLHGPEHHIIVAASLLTAYRNAGGKLDLRSALVEARNRGGRVPGGVCGFWGACGAGVSVGIFVSIATGSTPLAGREFGLANLATSKALGEIGAVGGPRCCKRDSYLAIIAAVEFARENLGVAMQIADSLPVVCAHSTRNNQCLGARCPFFPQNP